jgi:hypothetical protein
MGRKVGCERLGAKVRNCGLHRSRTRKSLKLPMARGRNMGLVQHFQAGCAAEKSSDCRDHRRRLYASGNADCDDYETVYSTYKRGKTEQRHYLFRFFD